MAFINDHNRLENQTLRGDNSANCDTLTNDVDVDNTPGCYVHNISDAKFDSYNQSSVDVFPEEPQEDNEDEAIIAICRTMNRVLISKCTDDKVRKNVSWKQATKGNGDLTKILEAQKKELSQIIIDYEVCKPVPRTGKKIKNYHRSHDLYDMIKDKARLVVGKAIRNEIIDYGVDISSPTLSPRLIYLMLSIAIEYVLEFEVWDVKGAFLKADLGKDGVYVRLEPHVASIVLDIIREKRPEDLKMWEECVNTENGSLMVECSKGWYGLPASSALWYKKISTSLESAGYTCHRMDKCLFMKKLEDGQRAYIMLHVDDMGVMMPAGHPERGILLGRLEGEFEELKKQTDNTLKYVGYEIFRDRELNRFELGMATYVERMVEKHLPGLKMDGICENPAMDKDFSSYDVAVEGVDGSLPYENITRFRSIVMGMHYATLVLPSVKYHVIFLATKQSKPSVRDMKLAEHVLKYMYASRNKRMYIYGFGESPKLYIYTDAAFDVYAGSMSHSGLAVFLGRSGGALYISSNKQKCVSHSSTEAEVIAAMEGVYVGQYYRDVLLELGLDVEVVHYEDNKSAIALIESGVQGFDRKDRHTIRKINSMHGYFNDHKNVSYMLYCNTHWMVCDGQTKCLFGITFRLSEDIQMGHDIDDIEYDMANMELYDELCDVSEKDENPQKL